MYKRQSRTGTLQDRTAEAWCSRKGTLQARAAEAWCSRAGTLQAQILSTASDGLTPSAFDPSLEYSTDNVAAPSYFSQWSPSSFVVDGVSYSCAEQFMMAAKARFLKTIAQWSSSCRRPTHAHTNVSVEAGFALTPLLETERSKMPYYLAITPN